MVTTNNHPYFAMPPQKVNTRSPLPARPTNLDAVSFAPLTAHVAELVARLEDYEQWRATSPSLLVLQSALSFAAFAAIAVEEELQRIAPTDEDAIAPVVGGERRRVQAVMGLYDALKSARRASLWQLEKPDGKGGWVLGEAPDLSRLLAGMRLVADRLSEQPPPGGGGGKKSAQPKATPALTTAALGPPEHPPADGPTENRGEFRLAGRLLKGLTKTDEALLLCLWNGGRHGEDEGQIPFDAVVRALYPGPNKRPKEVEEAVRKARVRLNDRLTTQGGPGFSATVKTGVAKRRGAEGPHLWLVVESRPAPARTKGGQR
jgi:hypothetical protein